MRSEDELRAELAAIRAQIEAYRNSQPDRAALAWSTWKEQQVALARQRDHIYGELSRRRYAQRVFDDAAQV